MKLLSKILLPLLLVLAAVCVNGQQLAFPGAEGYGKYASGGRGNGSTGRIAIVTNLEDDLENPPVGSLRWAVRQGVEEFVDPIIGPYLVKRPLTVVFRVGGVINLKGDLRIERKNITIAGQTALGDGICLRGGTVNMGGSDNVIVRFIRSRPGDELGLETSAFRIENGSNFIIDHCSFSWAIEETTHFSSSPNFTVQWCIISESFYRSFHQKGDRGYGSQHGGMYASYHHNLMAHHNSRTPRFNGSNENDLEALIDYRNNVNYNFGRSGSCYGGEWMKTNGLGFAATNMVNNYYIQGPGNYGTPYFVSPGTGDNGYASWYIDGNVLIGEDEKTTNNWLGVNYSAKDSIRVDNVIVKSDGGIEDYQSYTESAEEAYLSIIENVGATFPKRDAHDTRLIKEMTGEIAIIRYAYTDTAGTESPVKGVETGIIDTQHNLVSPEDRAKGVTPWDVYPTVDSTNAPVDTDNDGMPDDWELTNGLNPNDSTDFRLITESGYTNLEVYLAELVGDEINTAVKQIEQKHSDISVYPNPFSNKLTIKSSGNITVEVYDLYGRKITESKSLDPLHSINVDDWDAGFYLIRTTNESGAVNCKKVIKK
ncbi:T9SS type A sorting domain-containing protein [uncultured Draconibacterium sp.]|uniref:T9SS type A sorting domain-containing protein n=1 Tax=uncultured Draconibacterium sp. TaxID=1573823 RepID=UPI0025F930A6|nr:T9SS type A sorting domain-containing protein [uncultured Draconibacterium sp.]